ncbi:retinoschisin-like, partial, partial [Paramuricea clavata]
MVVKFATYRGLLAPKTCGSSDDYSCEVDVTCLVKKQCDGLHECNITVDDNLFSGDLCPGLSNYLYFEYQCVDTVKPYREPCVHDVSLSYSSLPYKGVVQITTDSGTKNVCWKSLKNQAKDIICRHLGYNGIFSLVNISTPTDAKNATFSGSINCNGEEKYLSQCSITASTGDSCSELSYIQCGSFRPLLEDEQRFPDSSFSASASSEGHSASDARMSSGSSWCAPVSDDKHYLQVDLGRQYDLDFFVTYGDSSGQKWVATYNLEYTVDLVNWKTLSRILQGNKNAYDHAAWGSISVRARALRFIPLTYVGQPCMRVDISGS